MIRLLADENVPRATVESLRIEGLDVCSVAEDMSGAPDVVVLESARTEHRLLLTFDRDFGELIYRRGENPPPGIIYFRSFLSILTKLPESSVACSTTATSR